jgi:hypothetical protein
MKIPAVFWVLFLDFLPHPVAAAGDGDRLAVVQQPVEDGRGDGVVVVEHPGPVFIGLVGGEDWSGSARDIWHSTLKELPPIPPGSDAVSSEFWDFDEGVGGAYAPGRIVGFEACSPARWTPRQPGILWVMAVSPVIPNCGTRAMTIFRLSGARRWYSKMAGLPWGSVGSMESSATSTPRRLL